ncbi:MAG: hypothetical protein ABR936_12450 [Bacteroidota bacterium]
MKLETENPPIMAIASGRLHFFSTYNPVTDRIAYPSKLLCNVS